MSEPEKKNETIDKTTVAKEEWSKEKQRADQSEANYRKLVTEKDEIILQLSERDEKLAKLESRMEELAKSEEVPVEDLLDPDLVDAKTIKTVSKMAKQIREQKTAIDKLSKLAETFQENSRRQEVKTEKEKTIEKILKPLDEEYGAKFRNQARKLADSLVDEGKEKQPQDVIEAMLFMRKCYEKVRSEALAAEKEQTKKVQTDNGSSSISFDDSIPKSGTRREILKGMKGKGLKLFGSE